MGCSGHHAFENDTALDWVTSLEEDGIKSVKAAFEALLDEDDAPEGPICEVAIAAAEVVAAVIGNAGPDLPEEVKVWVAEQKQAGPALVAQARASIERILADSELKDLWSESAEDFKNGVPGSWNLLNDSVQGTQDRSNNDLGGGCGRLVHCRSRRLESAPIA